MFWSAKAVWLDLKGSDKPSEFDRPPVFAMSIFIK